MYKAKIEFSSTRGVYRPGEIIKIRNEAILERWLSAGYIEKVEEVTETAEDKPKKKSDSKPRLSDNGEV